jgi:hypothetical protein
MTTSIKEPELPRASSFLNLVRIFRRDIRVLRLPNHRTETIVIVELLPQPFFDFPVSARDPPVELVKQFPMSHYRRRKLRVTGSYFMLALKIRMIFVAGMTADLRGIEVDDLDFRSLDVRECVFWFRAVEIEDYNIAGAEIIV